MNMYGVIIFASLAVSPIFAQSNQTFDGPCPTILSMDNFNEERFSGTWYEYQRYNNIFITGQCGLPKYDKQASGGYKVKFLTTNLEDKANSTSEIELKNKEINSRAGDYDVFVGGKKEEIGQKVLNTDYDNYGIVWGCSEKDAPTGKRVERLSIYTRNNTPSAETLKKVTDFLTSKDIKHSDDTLLKVEQDDKKCGRNSAPTIMLPTMFASVIALLLTNKF